MLMIRLAVIRGIIVLFCSILAVLFVMPLSCSSSDSGTKVEILLGMSPLDSAETDESGSQSVSHGQIQQTVEILKPRLSAEPFICRKLFNRMLSEVCCSRNPDTLSLQVAGDVVTGFFFRTRLFLSVKVRESSVQHPFAGDRKELIVRPGICKT